MKIRIGWLLVLVLLLAAGRAAALELKTRNGVTPYDRNPITVTSEKPGTLTIRAMAGERELENPVTELNIEAGTTELTWQAVTFGGEPIHKGVVKLTAVLKTASGETETAEHNVRILETRSAAVACLPASRGYCPGSGETLLIEVTLTQANPFTIELTPADNPEEIVWQTRIAEGTKEPNPVHWNGRIGHGQNCPPGEYILTVYTWSVPDVKASHPLTILAEPELSPELAVTGPLLPEDPEDDEAVWQALTAPIAVGTGGEGKGLHILVDKNAGYGKDVGTCNCRTVGLQVLEIGEDGWVKVGAWRQKDGAYVEGYVKREQIRMIRPHGHYGAVVDKRKQTMTVYEDGKRLGTMLISTGLVTPRYPKAETHSGAYLIGTRMSGFAREGYNYIYPLRIDGANLIHQLGYLRRNNTEIFTDQIAELGRKASHGCIRMDMRVTEENGGINAWWVWTHFEKDTKIFVTEDDETMHLTAEEAIKK